MTQIVLVAHAPLASAFLAAATHVYPDCASQLDAIDVGPGDDVIATEARLRSIVLRDPLQEVLILVDAFGATPCNVAQRVADGHRVRVVAGLNVPMLWRTLCYGQERLEGLVGRAVAGATQGVMHVAVNRPQYQSPMATPASDAQDADHHQQ